MWYDHLFWELCLLLSQWFLYVPVKIVLPLNYTDFVANPELQPSLRSQWNDCPGDREFPWSQMVAAIFYPTCPLISILLTWGDNFFEVIFHLDPENGMGACLWAVGTCLWGECWWAVGTCLWGILVSSEHMSMGGDAGGQWADVYEGCWWAVSPCLWGVLVGRSHLSCFPSSDLGQDLERCFLSWMASI